jgi:hypothetical protein
MRGESKLSPLSCTDAVRRSEVETGTSRRCRESELATFWHVKLRKSTTIQTSLFPINNGVRHPPGLDSLCSSYSLCWPLPPGMSLSAQQLASDGNATASSHRCRSATATSDSSCLRDRRARRPQETTSRASGKTGADQGRSCKARLCPAQAFLEGVVRPRDCWYALILSQQAP